MILEIQGFDANFIQSFLCGVMRWRNTTTPIIFYLLSSLVKRDAMDYVRWVSPIQ